MPQLGLREKCQTILVQNFWTTEEEGEEHPPCPPSFARAPVLAWPGPQGEFLPTSKCQPFLEKRASSIRGDATGMLLTGTRGGPGVIAV